MKTSALKIALKALGLTTVFSIADEVVLKAEKENWSYNDFLLFLCENELNERKNKKIERYLKLSKLPDGKTLSTLNEAFLPSEVRKQIPCLLHGKFIEKAVNVLAFGLPGRGKTHFLCAIAHELIMKYQYKILFTPTYKIIQALQNAKEKLELENALKKFDSFDIIIIDDIGYVQHTREEMEVFFTFLADRYERKSLMISSNLTFSKWENIFKNPMTAMAAVDRLVHHSIIIEFDNDSIRAKQACQKDRKAEKNITKNIEKGGAEM